ncbi:hypothetical protein KIH87_14290 [Paraneptunicella aestuarii]|uniref:hypothetical protein n=1 Tax=Paraneptunicella aestuarii TaxID=2831148 RepID=UPI001E36D2EE|nr:hypothetical protein [Paraneptunicella aestuarii]UAA37857.1 hypothetical protein KIH87_14290 [Paraneptunicella aestuarii]
MTNIPQEKLQSDVAVQSNAGIYTARRAAEHLLHEINSNHEFLIPSFLSSIAAGIEGEINTAYINHFHKKFGKQYTKHIKPYLFMKIYDRLSQLPIVLSGFKYMLNDQDERIKAIFELFELRNRVLHIKHLHHYADIYQDENGNILNINYHTPNHPDPYREHFANFPKIEELNSYLELFYKVIRKFNNLSDTINRRNFNPEGWFIRISKT